MSQLLMHNLRPAKGAKRYPKVVGRGNASGKGTTAGRGGKGQTARTGGRNKLKLLGMRHIILATPKLRGNRLQPKPKAANVSLGQLDAAYKVGEEVNRKTLQSKGLIKTTAPKIKILSGGSLKKKLVFTGVKLSEEAKAKVLAAGGEVR